VSDTRAAALVLARAAVELLEDPDSSLHSVFTALSKALNLVLKAQGEESL